VAVSASAARTRRSVPWVAGWLALLALAVYALSGGGRVVGSDEVTMLEVSRAMLRGGIDVPEGATLPGRDGRHYSKNAAAQAVLALPLVATAEGAAAAAGLDPARRTLAVRFAASFFNALVTALLLAALYRAAVRLGATPRAALAAALMLGFATPVWVYAKSFMAEPLQALGLLLALDGAARAGAPGRDGAGAGLAAGVGAFLAVSAKLSMLPIALCCLLPLLVSPVRAWLAPALGVVAALAGHAAYSVARFGTPFETGYGAQATAAAYTTPLLVGLYGLLVSSGKGALWFAPGLWLAPAGWLALRRAGGRWGLGNAGGRAAWGALAAWVGALALYARFQHWAGDGSFGPRYLVPVLPLAFLVVAFALDGPRPRARRTAAVVLAAIGLFVQIGGVGIYFGAQMREAGDYPYRLPLEHPRSLSDSHFNPRFSPIAGHWSMLLRNAGEHLRGALPRLDPGGAGEEPRDPRTGLNAGEQRALLHAIDLWWLYLAYAGYGGWPLAAGPLALAAIAAFAAARLRAALAAPDPAGPAP
jgi:hypothetical protein